MIRFERRDRARASTLDEAQIAHERVVLGAAISGALTLRDLHDLPLDAWVSPHHATLASVIEALLTLRANYPKLLPGRSGLPLDRLLDVCAKMRIWPAGKWIGLKRPGRAAVPYAIGYLPTIARSAPRRGEALRAKAALITAAQERIEAEHERARARRTLADLVPPSLLALSPEEREAVFAEAESWRTRRAG